MKKTVVVLGFCLALLTIPTNSLAPVDISPDDDEETSPSGHRRVLRVSRSYGQLPRDDVFFSRGRRLLALANAGGSDKTERSVLMALRWLKQEQNEDGSWGEKPIRTAMTGLALLAFLGHGEDHLSIEFGATVRRGISWLVGNQDENGYFTQEMRWAYQHGIATYAMAEAYGMTGLEELRPVVAKAVRRICEGQTREGGWYYGYAKTGNDGGPRRGGDTSVSGWQIQALNAAWYTGIRFSNNMLRNARRLAAKDIKSRFSKEQGCGYTGTAPSRGAAENYCTTAAGTLCLLSLGQRDSDEVKAGLRLMSKYSCDWKKTTGGAFGPLYGWYYVTQAMFHATPNPKKNEYWQYWNPLICKGLVNRQQADGHWDFPKSEGGQREKRHFPGKNEHVYSTAMCCLMLETYYRHPPDLDVEVKPVGQPIRVEKEDDDAGGLIGEETDDEDVDEDLWIGDADLGLDEDEDEDLGLDEDELLALDEEDEDGEEDATRGDALHGLTWPWEGDPEMEPKRFVVVLTGRGAWVNRRKIPIDTFVEMVSRFRKLGEDLQVLLTLTESARREDIRTVIRTLTDMQVTVIVLAVSDEKLAKDDTPLEEPSRGDLSPIDIHGDWVADARWLGVMMTEDGFTLNGRPVSKEDLLNGVKRLEDHGQEVAVFVDGHAQFDQVRVVALFGDLLETGAMVSLVPPYLEARAAKEFTLGVTLGGCMLNRRPVAPEFFLEVMANLNEMGEEIHVILDIEPGCRQKEVIGLLKSVLRTGATVGVIPPYQNKK